jgi:hypothetical protein
VAKIQGKCKIINLGAITHSGGVSWAVTHFLPVYDPSLDTSIKDQPGELTPYRVLPLDNLASFGGYYRFDGKGEIDESTISDMDRNLASIKGQKLFRLPQGLTYALEKQAAPFGKLAQDNVLSEMEQLGMSHYNAIRNGRGIVAMPPVSQDQAKFYLGSSESYRFDKQARFIQTNDGSVFTQQLASDMFDFDDVFFDWDNLLYRSCNYNAERVPSNALAAQGNLSCRLVVPKDGGEMVFNKFLFFISGMDEKGHKLGKPPMLFAEQAFDRKYYLASSKSQIELGSTAVLNAFVCTFSLKYEIGRDTPLEGVILNENEWVSNAILLENTPDEARVWKMGNGLDMEGELTEAEVEGNSLLQDTYSHTFQQAYSGDVGVGTMHPRARLHLSERTLSTASPLGHDEQELSLYNGIYPHARFSDKHDCVGMDFRYADAFLDRGENESPLAGMLQISPTDRLIRSGIAMFKNAYAIGLRGALAVGENARAEGDSAMALGWKAEALHDLNIALGWDTRAVAYLGGAIGHKAYVGELTRFPNVPGFSKSASYALGHYAKSDSGLAIGVNAEARGFWYELEHNLDDEDIFNEAPNLDENGNPVQHGHTCDCPVCKEAIGHLMLASEYDCADDEKTVVGEAILRQFGKLFSYAVGKNVLSGSMSGAIGLDVEVKAFSSLGMGRNVKMENYYSTAIGSDIELLGGSQANMVFAKWMKMTPGNDNSGNTIIGQQMEIGHIKNSLVTAYGINLQFRGQLENIIVNSVRSSYVDIPYGFAWNSPRFIDLSILSNITLAAQTATAYWEGINVGIRNKVSTRSVTVGVNCAETGGSNVMVGREIYGVNIVGFGKNITINEGNAFGHRLYDVAPFGNFQYGTLIGNDLYNIGGVVIGQFSKSVDNYYYNTDLSPKYGFRPVLTVAGGDGARHWHALELGKSVFKKAVLNAGSHSYNNFGSLEDSLSLWNLIPTETAFPTVADLLASNSNGAALRDLINRSGGFLIADNFTGYLKLSGKGYGIKAGMPGGANAHTFTSMVGLALGGAWHSDNFGPLPFHGVSKYKGYGVNATHANQGEASLSAILARAFKNLYGYRNSDDAQVVSYWLDKCVKIRMNKLNDFASVLKTLSVNKDEASAKVVLHWLKKVIKQLEGPSPAATAPVTISVSGPVSGQVSGPVSGTGNGGIGGMGSFGETHVSGTVSGTLTGTVQGTATVTQPQPQASASSGELPAELEELDWKMTSENAEMAAWWENVPL